MAERAKDDFESLREDLATLREDVAKLAADLRGLAGNAAGAARHAASEEGARLREDLEETLRSIVGRGNKVVESASARIEERPLVSVLLAFVVGFVLARIMDRRG